MLSSHLHTATPSIIEKDRGTSWIDFQEENIKVMYRFTPCSVLDDVHSMNSHIYMYILNVLLKQPFDSSFSCFERFGLVLKCQT